MRSSALYTMAESSERDVMSFKDHQTINELSIKITDDTPQCNIAR